VGAATLFIDVETFATAVVLAGESSSTTTNRGWAMSRTRTMLASAALAGLALTMLPGAASAAPADSVYQYCPGTTQCVTGEWQAAPGTIYVDYDITTQHTAGGPADIGQVWLLYNNNCVANLDMTSGHRAGTITCHTDGGTVQVAATMSKFDADINIGWHQ
jgi:hypothetical protein